MIDITNLPKNKVLATLFNNSKQQGMGFLDVSGSINMTLEDAQKIVDSGRLSFDYLRGRVMKVDISDNSFDPRLYDRDNGNGAASRAIDLIR